MNQKLQFDVYYLGTGTYQSPPPFSNGVYKDTLAIELQTHEKPNLSGYQTIGTFNSSNYKINYNQLGGALNNECPFLNDTGFSVKMPYSTTWNTRYNNFVESFVNIVDLNSYLPTYQGNTHYFFALAGKNTYQLCYVVPLSSSTSREEFYGGSKGIYSKSDSTLISTSNQYVFPIPGDMRGNSNLVCDNLGSVRYYEGNYWFYRILARSGSNTIQIAVYDFNEEKARLVNDFIYVPENPYDGGGSSTEDVGGEGNFDDSSTPISAPTLPATTVTGTGFVRIYNPSLSQLQNLARYMWTDTNFIDTIVNLAKKMLENPMSAIITLNMLPCPIPSGAPENVKVMFIDTGVQMSPATTQFVDVDCGYYDVSEYYGSALDYSPNTKIQCFLPYIGQVAIDTDEVMGKRVSIKYRIDISTGTCVAMIMVDGSVLYQHSGHCAIAMPLTSGDFSSYVSAALGIAKAAGGLIAGAAGATPLASALVDVPMPSSSSTYTKTTNTSRNAKTGRQNITDTSVRESITTRGPSYGEIAKAGVTNAVQSIMGAKANVEHSGGFTGNSGYLGVRRPYLIFQIPRMCLPENYGRYRGYPSMIYVNLGNCRGYTEVQEIHMTGIPATNPELSEIVTLLKGGVVF